MSDAATVTVIFIVLGFTAILVMLLFSERGQSSMTIGRARFQIDFEKGNWKRYRPDKKPRANRKSSPQAYENWLEVKRTSWRYPLKPGSTVYIGRRDDNQIRLTDRRADSRQAVIYWENGRFKINNLSSRRPTLVNGKRFTKQNLGNGNTISMGRTKLIFRDGRYTPQH